MPPHPPNLSYLCVVLKEKSDQFALNLTPIQNLTILPWRYFTFSVIR